MNNLSNPQNVHPLGELVKQFVKEYKVDSRFTEMELRSSWSRLMGEAVQKYTSEINFANGTLYVRMTSAPLREELSFKKEKLIHHLNKHLGGHEIKELKFI